MTNNTPDYKDNLYFDAQNTKKDLCNTSEQLTDGYHYAIVFDKERIIEKKKDLTIPYCEGFCCQNYQYLAPVPSYEEWKELIESEEKSHLQADSYYNKILELKDLLKEVKYYLPEFETPMDILAKIDEVLK